MPRQRIGVVAEPLESLAQLEQTLTDPYKAQKLRLLTLVQCRPEITYSELAAELRSTSRTVRRWWRAYQLSGLSGLLNLTADVGFDRTQAVAPTDVRYSRLLNFLNALRPENDARAWILTLRSALTNLLDGVDSVSVALTVTHGMFDAAQSPPDSIIRQAINLDTPGVANEISLAHRSTPPQTAILETMRRAGMDVDTFHIPTLIPIEADGSRVGTIVLWARRSGPDVPADAVSLMQSIRPFLGFVLADALLRFHMDNPGTRTYCDVVNRIAERYALHPRELEVLTHHIFGRSNVQIAERLYLSVNSVRKYVKSLHKKTGCSSYNELLAQYLHPD